MFKVGDHVRAKGNAFKPENPEGYTPCEEGFKPGAVGVVVDLTPGGYALEIAGMPYMPFYPNELEAAPEQGELDV